MGIHRTLRRDPPTGLSSIGQGLEVSVYIALLTVIAAQAFSYTASACTGTYAGYPCSQWNKMQDR